MKEAIFYSNKEPEISGENNKIDVNKEKFNNLLFSKIEKFFLDSNIIAKDSDNSFSVDLERLGDLRKEFIVFPTFSYLGKNKTINKSDILEYLMSIRGYDKKDEEKTVKSIISTPKNIQEARLGNFSDGLVLPWEAITDRGPGFSKKIKLSDGTDVSIADLFYLKKIKDLKIHRDVDGKLKYFNKDKDDFDDFNFSTCDFGMDINIRYKKSKSDKDFIPCGMKYHPAIFIKKFLPIVDSLNLFKIDTDFKMSSGNTQSEMFFVNSKKISKKNPYASFSEDFGMIRYYLGRNKIIGTDKDINDNIRIVEMDKENIGIMEEQNGKMNLLYTFKRINNEEFNKFGFSQKKDVNRSLSSEEMKTRIKKYQVSDYIPRLEEESVEDYANRLSKLGDVNFIINNFREIIGGAGLFLRDFSWREQVLLSNYTLSLNSREKLLGFLSLYKENGLRSFLSLEQDKGMGDKILFIGESLPEDISGGVFNKYSEIVGNVKNISDFIENNFSSEIKGDQDFLNKIESVLLEKGKDIIEDVYNKTKNKDKVDFTEIKAKLDRISADTIATLAIFKQALRGGNKIPIESIKGAVFSRELSNELSPEEQNEMVELYKINWKDHPDKDFVDGLIEYFKKSFHPEEEDKNYFYIFRKDDRIRAFVRFERNNNSVYASALNVDDASKNFGLGEAMMDEALIREAKNNILRASCKKNNPSNMRYFEKGFISTGFKKTNDTEEFDLIWDDINNNNILAKQKSEDELISMYNSGSYEGSIEIKREADLNPLNQDMISGKYLVRCFRKNDYWYAVYEVVDKNYGLKGEEVK